MKNLYKRPEWITFRDEMIEREGGKCSRCGYGITAGAILQVHHKQYIPDRKPWEYNYNECETLCKGCHASEHDKIMPKTGWEFSSSEDLGDLSGVCDYCNTDLRYLCIIYHKKWGFIGVGETCCDNLTETNLATQQVSKMKKKEKRLSNFIKSSRWTIVNGNSSIKQKGYKIMVKFENNKFRLVINGDDGKKTEFETLDQAKRHLFEIIENGRLDKYWKNKVPF